MHTGEDSPWEGSRVENSCEDEGICKLQLDTTCLPIWEPREAVLNPQQLDNLPESLVLQT